MKYAIEIIGGSRKRYIVAAVTASGLIVPVDGKSYRTETAARAAAAASGIEISAVGDLWQIVKLAEGRA